MQLQQIGKFHRYLFILSIFFSNAQADWSGELYGGRYYDDKRFGSYLVYSNANPRGQTMIAEVLYEQYTDYEFAGIGGHFLWPVARSIELGLIVSQAWESYEFIGYGEFDYQTNTAGIELEFNGERVTLAAQSGMYFTGYDDTDSMYLSANLYYMGQQNNWYLRGATRWISTDSLHIIEGYRTMYLMGFPFTTYLGMSAEYSNNDSSAAIDSVYTNTYYTGVYVELFSIPSSTLFLWTEIAELDGEALLTIELSLIFGPGAKTPYITAFGSSLTD
jgi:hypothetical protein